jgi:hypothetical protein
MANERARRDTQAGLIAASDYVVSKQIFNRPAPLPSSTARLRAPNLSDVPRLFSGQETAEDDSSWQHRVGRLSSAALMYSADKKEVRQADRLLRGSDSEEFEERALLKKLHDVRKGSFEKDRSCPHCRLLYSSLYRDGKWKFPPIQVVHHNKDAKVIVNFDSDTYISEGKVDKFQVIVPSWVAEEMINSAHPLDWANAPGNFFKSITAVQADGSRGDLTGTPEEIKAKWEEKANDGSAYILEDVEWPINQNLRSNAENILKITGFAKKDDSIEYDYSLQRCVRTNFGVAWEPSGLDIDGGKYKGSRIHLDPKKITAQEIESGQLPLRHLTRRDVLELKTQNKSHPEDWQDLFNTEDDKMLYTGKWSPPGDEASFKDIAEAVEPLVINLKKTWNVEFDLLTLSLSKQLHFTVLEYSPIELWHLLTWMAPATLFVFLNAVCQAPHILVKGNKQVFNEGSSSV